MAVASPGLSSSPTRIGWPNGEPRAWPDDIGDIAGRIRAFDWGATSLGPIGCWPQCLRTTVDILLRSPVPMVLLWGRDGVVIHNDAYRAVLGRRHPDPLGATLRDGGSNAIGLSAEIMDAVLAGGSLTCRDREFWPNGADVGSCVRADLVFSLVLDETGGPAGALGIVRETTVSVAADRDRLSAESASRDGDPGKASLVDLQHRMRNALAVVRSIARRTGATAESIEQYATHLDGRLNAFARMQVLAMRDPAAGVDLEFLVAEELLVYRAEDGQQVAIEGPPVRLQVKAAETFGLAIHELATNAIKYGALAHPCGRVSVNWTIEPAPNGPWLTFKWVETGYPTKGLSLRRRGFGTDMIERTLVYEWKAVTSLRLPPEGLTCSIGLPMTKHVLAADRPASKR